MALSKPVSLFPALMALLLLMFAHWTEQKFFPVVRDFTVLQMTRSEDKLQVGGLMRKDRPCKYIGVSAFAIYADGAADLISMRTPRFGD